MKNRNEYILQTLQAILKLLIDRLPDTDHHNHMEMEADENGQTAFEEAELMTLRQAYLELKISRGTLNKLRQEGKLTSIYQGRNTRLIRAEALAAKKWYSVKKGKI